MVMLMSFWMHKILKFRPFKIMSLCQFIDIESGPDDTKNYFVILNGSKNWYVLYFISVEHRIKKNIILSKIRDVLTPRGLEFD